MKKYGMIVNEVVKVISYVKKEGFVLVPDDCYAGYHRLPDGSFRPPKLPLKECKDEKLIKITDQYDALVHAGFNSEGVRYESTLENQNRIIMVKIAGGGMVMADGKMVMLNASKANKVFDDMSTYINSCNQRYAKAQSEIEKAKKNDQVNSVVF